MSEKLDLNSYVHPAVKQAYSDCKGNPDNFKAGKNDSRYELVRLWAPVIEHQIARCRASTADATTHAD